MGKPLSFFLIIINWLALIKCLPGLPTTGWFFYNHMEQDRQCFSRSRFLDLVWSEAQLAPARVEGNWSLHLVLMSAMATFCLVSPGFSHWDVPFSLMPTRASFWGLMMKRVVVEGRGRWVSQSFGWGQIKSKGVEKRRKGQIKQNRVSA